MARPEVVALFVMGVCGAQDAIPTFGVTAVAPYGFCGRIYEIPEGSATRGCRSRLPRFGTLRSVGRIYATSLNVPPRDFREGFPGVTDRFEWFAIDYTTRFWIETPGEYSFALWSDDGSALYIDERRIVTNDCVHPPSKRRASVRLAGGIHDMRVSYFQGPRWSVALVLHVRPPGGDWRVFDTDEFRPPPNPADWKYPNPRNLDAPVDPCTAGRHTRELIARP